MPVKISIIGAGSGAFSLNIIRDICLTPNLRGCTISFMDIDPERLDGVYTLCKRYAGEVGLELNLQKTLDRQESLQDADFVINTALTAGHHRLRAGWEIAQKYGYRYGGSLAIMHDEAFWINFYQLRLFDSIISDVLKVCPQAWYLQVANSVLGGITYLSRKYPKAKIVGVCHGFNGVYKMVDLLGLERENLTFEMPGVNHFIWLTQMYYKGENVFPLFDQWIEKEAPHYWETCGYSDDYGPKEVDCYRRFGAFPIGDTATPGGGSWGWWYHIDKETEQKWKEDPVPFWQWYFNGVEGSAAEIKRIGSDLSTKVSDHFKPHKSSEIIVPMIESIAYDIPRTMICNIANTGNYVPGVPSDFTVEIWTMVSKRGIQGVQSSGLPPMVLAYLQRDRVVPVNLELKAYDKGSRQLLLELIRMDPWTQTEQQARQLLEDILALPFHKEMRDHYI